MTPAEARDALAAAQARLETSIIGQPALSQRLLLALICDGHLLVEGRPGLAKTRAIRALSTLLHLSFHRVQFTPDLLPSDLTGTDIFVQGSGTFEFRQGPLFHNLILADEINRAPAKVQSALLEAMEERQITVGLKSWQLPQPFLVMATQNPIEQHGTNPLPEAQLDRFFMHVPVDYPTVDDEVRILELARDEWSRATDSENEPTDNTSSETISVDALTAAKQGIADITMSPELARYIVRLVVATRPKPGQTNGPLAWGAGPRAAIYIERAARATAWLKGRSFVAPEDCQQVAHDVLRHRLGLTYDAQADGTTADMVVSDLLTNTPITL